MAIQAGDTLPLEIKLKELKDGVPTGVTTGDLFKGKRVVVFAVPGAFTRTCSAKHLPGFLAEAEAIRAKGVADVLCLAVNDAFVMGASGSPFEKRLTLRGCDGMPRRGGGSDPGVHGRVPPLARSLLTAKEPAGTVGGSASPPR